MEPLIRCCAGLDIHKKTIEAHIRRIEPDGTLYEKRGQWGTTTRELEQMSAWLKGQQVTHVAMESTGVFWKPVYNILEGRFRLLLVNARHLKRVPGRKTDVSDAQWIAHCLQVGLLRGSFVPERWQRELRDLTRLRTQLIGEQSRVINRIQKVLQDANIKLSSVVSDIVGASGRDMLGALIKGEQDEMAMAELARRSLRGKIPQLREALRGKVTEHHRFLLQFLMDELESHDRSIRALDRRIEEYTHPFEQQLVRMDEIPGIDRRVAETLLAEIGPDMKPFPSEDALCSWAAICPGNDESAGKRRSGRTRKGNRWLRQVLVQAAWGASRKKGSYLNAHYHRLAARRGNKRALLAVGHSILVIVYHMITRATHYQDLGAEYLDRLRPERTVRYLVKRLEGLGLKVTLEASQAPA